MTKTTGKRPKSADKVVAIKHKPHEIDWNGTLLHDCVDCVDILPPKEVHEDVGIISIDSKEDNKIVGAHSYTRELEKSHP